MKRKMAVIFRLICVRHGETEANKEMRIQGHLNIPLSNIGKAQAQEAGASLTSVPFTRAYASDLLRARETCEYIIEKNSLPLETIKTDERIRERNFGCVEGMLFREVLEMARKAGKSWPAYSPPGAESLGEVQQRLVEFFKELCQSVYDRSKNIDTNSYEETSDDEMQEKIESSEKILVVSHGAALRELYTHFRKTLNGEGFPEASDALSKISPNTGISEFIIKYQPRKYHIKCVRLNDAKHLESLKLDQ